MIHLLSPIIDYLSIRGFARQSYHPSPDKRCNRTSATRDFGSVELIPRLGSVNLRPLDQESRSSETKTIENGFVRIVVSVARVSGRVLRSA